MPDKPKELAHSETTSNHQVIRGPYAKWFGLEIDEVNENSAKVHMVVESHHLNIFGNAHGGVCLSLADHACGALLTAIAKDMFYATVTLNSAYFRPAVAGKLMATAELISRSKTTAHIEASITQNNKLLFKSSGSFAIRPKR